VVPHCNTAEAVRRVVRAVKYPPNGNRGAGSSSRAADYRLRAGAAEYFAAANEQTLALPMIEEAEALDNLDAILAVDGLEAIFIGPGDLALTVGYPGQINHPAVRDKVNLVIERARARGIWVGTTGRDVEGTLALLDQWVGLILGNAASLFAAAGRSFLEALRR
jgi:4-hydroxy-2-oxoheptanedioate aldolase